MISALYITGYRILGKVLIVLINWTTVINKGITNSPGVAKAASPYYYYYFLKYYSLPFLIILCIYIYSNSI